MASMVHVRYEGESVEYEQGEDIDVGPLSSDQEVRTAVAALTGAPLAKLDNFMVDRNEATGDVTLRPQAVFG